jgi:hypothetical protein
METQPINMQVGVSGVLEFRDADGNLIKTVEVNAVIPVTELEATDGNQRSE